MSLENGNLFRKVFSNLAESFVEKTAEEITLTRGNGKIFQGHDETQSKTEALKGVSGKIKNPVKTLDISEFAAIHSS